MTLSFSSQSSQKATDHVYTCIWMHVGTHISAVVYYMWRPEDSLMCRSLGCVYLASWDRVSRWDSSTGLVVQQVPRFSFCLLPRGWDHGHSSTYLLGSQTHISIPSTLCVFWGLNWGTHTYAASFFFFFYQIRHFSNLGNLFIHEKNDYFEVMAHVSNPSPLEEESGGSRVLGLPRILRESEASWGYKRPWLKKASTRMKQSHVSRIYSIQTQTVS